MIIDPISDMFVRIRNANALCYKQVSMYSSKIKVEIAKILKNEGFILDFEVSEETKNKKKLIIFLKYTNKNERIISGIKRISKPSLRITTDAKHLPNVFNGFGIAIISTSKGLMTNFDSKKNNLGGEIIAYVW